MAVDLEARDLFAARHIGPDAAEEAEMLRALGVASLEALLAETVPPEIRLRAPLDLAAPVGEAEVLRELRALADQNQIWRSFIGLGYYDCFTPPVIQRNILENPGWYTQYTPYQAEISQGRLEALLNFQTMVADLTGLPVANASLLDEATAAGEAMQVMDSSSSSEGARAIFVSDACHPQTIDVLRTRAVAHGVEVVVGDALTFDFGKKVFGVLLQYPASDGTVDDWRSFIARAHAEG